MRFRGYHRIAIGPPEFNPSGIRINVIGRYGFLCTNQIADLSSFVVRQLEMVPVGFKGTGEAGEDV